MIKQHQQFARRVGSLDRACGMVEAAVARYPRQGILVYELFNIYRNDVGVLNLWDAINKLIDEGVVTIVSENDIAASRRIKHT